jgi:hypothetical protein
MIRVSPATLRLADAMSDPGVAMVMARAGVLGEMIVLSAVMLSRMIVSP